MQNDELEQHKRALAEGKKLGPRMVTARYSRTHHKLTVEFDNGWGVVVPIADVKDFQDIGREPSAAELSWFALPSALLLCHFGNYFPNDLFCNFRVLRYREQSWVSRLPQACDPNLAMVFPCRDGSWWARCWHPRPGVTQ